MRLQSLITILVFAVQSVWAAPPPENQRVLVVVDDTNPDVAPEAIAEPLISRGYQVDTAGVKDHPSLSQYGERLYDNLVIVPGRVKALGSTLRQSDLLDFLTSGGNIVALTTPKFSPLALRGLSNDLGIEVSGRGVEFVDGFDSNVDFPQPNVITAPEGLSGSKSFEGAAVAKLGSNELLLGLVQSPYTSYAWNAGKSNADDAKAPASDVFSAGGESFLAAGLQSLSGSRFVWVGSPFFLTNDDLAQQITGWAFGETGNLRLKGATHESVSPEDFGNTHLHYMVNEPLKYCAAIEKWNPDAREWQPYHNNEDVQLEFKMLDPYYRLNLDKHGCAVFNAPDQYGMFTFSLDYRRPGYSFLDDKQVVTIRHRANDEWDRSWSITNSWVYLSGVSTTVFGFLIFCVLYLTLPSPFVTKTAEASEATPAKATTTKGAAVAATKEPSTNETKPKAAPKKSRAKKSSS